VLCERTEGLAALADTFGAGPPRIRRIGESLSWNPVAGPVAVAESLDLRHDPIESARARDMLTPFELIAGLWLGAWSTWGGALGPALPLPGPKATPTATSPARDDPASLLELSDEELAKRIESDPGALGSLSIGSPGSAVLFNALALEAGPRWEIAPGADSWGTAETMAAIRTVIDTVYELFPETSPVSIGDISGVRGGRLKHHESHQGGRDVDFGFYYQAGRGTWFTPGTAANLDLARNWALVRALLVRTDVETIFLDTRIQRLLYQHALSISEDKDWLDRVFQFSRGFRDAIIQHLPNHRTHYHVRFYNPVAQELGRRAHPILVQLKMMDPPVFTVQHVVRAGQTLGHLAARYGTSVRAIMQANGLVTTRLAAGRAYRIPMRTAAPPSQPVVIPPRLLPPQTPAALAAVDWPTQQSLYGTGSERRP
jgi:murein endopeptidase